MVSIASNTSFQAKLLASLEMESDDEEEVCLISGEPFSNYPPNEKITLPCKHSFMRSAIFKEITYQKHDWKVKKQTSSWAIKYFKKLRPNQMMCPYCRKIHKRILPKWKGFPVIYGVNDPPQFCMNYSSKCLHMITPTRQCKTMTKNKYCSNHIKFYMGVNLDTTTTTSTSPLTNLIEQSILNTTTTQTNPNNTEIFFAEDTTENTVNDLSTTFSNPKTKKKSKPNTASKSCQKLLTSGKRKGEPCGCRAKFSTTHDLNNPHHNTTNEISNELFWYCGRHYHATQ